MAPLTLNQVSGSNTLLAAAQQVGFLTEVSNTFGLNFGDPFLLSAVAAEWTKASTAVGVAKGLIAGSSNGGTTNYRDFASAAWTGSAALSFFTAENVLENGITQVKGAMDVVAKQLGDLAAAIWKVWALAVASTITAIDDVLKLLHQAWLVGRQIYKNVTAPPPAPPAPDPNPILVNGPGGSSVVIANPAQPQPTPPSSGAAGNWQLVLDAATKIKLRDLLRAWMVTIAGYLFTKAQYDVQVTTSLTALNNSLITAKAYLPNGKLPAVTPSPLP
jgi:hypothetical protein